MGVAYEKYYNECASEYLNTYMCPNHKNEHHFLYLIFRAKS